MRQNSMNHLIWLLLFVSPATSALMLQFEILSDPTKLSKVNLIGQDVNEWKWLYHHIEGSSSVLTYFEYNPNKPFPSHDSITQTINYATEVKAISDNMNCVLLQDLASPNIFNISLYSVNSSGINLKKDVSDLANSFNSEKVSFQVGDLCSAIRINSQTYRFNQISSNFDMEFTQMWTDPVASNDFSFVVSKQAIYRYNPTFKIYQKLKSKIFLTFKIVKTSEEKMLIFSWANDTEKTNKYKWEANAFKISGSNLTELGTIKGQCYGSPSSKGPNFVVSPFLTKFIVYGPISGKKYFIKGMFVDSTKSLAKPLEFDSLQMNLFLNAQSAVSLSEDYLYMKNLQFVKGQLKKYYAIFQILNNNVYTAYGPSSIVGDPIGENNRLSIIFNSPERIELTLQTQEKAKVSLNTLSVIIQNDIVSLSPQESGNNLFTVTNTTIYEANYDLSWIIQKYFNNSKKNFEATSKNIGNGLSIAKIEMNSNETFVKSLSRNKKCGLFYQSNTSNLYTYDFRAQKKIQIPKILYSSKNLTNINTDISNDCTAFRIDQTIYHFTPATNNYVADQLPSGLTHLPNVSFSEDFSMAVANDAVYKYTPSTGSTAGFYTLHRSDKYHQQKFVWAFKQSLLIFSYRQISGTNKFQFKVQFNFKGNMTFQTIGDVSGKSTEMPKIVVSQKIWVFGVYGKSFQKQSSPFYQFKFFNTNNMTLKDIQLPNQIKDSFYEVSLSDEYIVFSKMESSELQQYAYAIIGSTLFEIFNEKLRPQPTYQRTLVRPDSRGGGKIVLAYQSVNNQKISVKQYAKSSTRQGFEQKKFGFEEDRYLFKSSSKKYQQNFHPLITARLIQYDQQNPAQPKLTFTRYDPSASNKITVVSKILSNKTTNFEWKGNSRNLDCIISYEHNLSMIAYILVNQSIVQTANFLPLLQLDFSNDIIRSLRLFLGRGCAVLASSGFGYNRKLYVLNKSTNPWTFVKDTTSPMIPYQAQIFYGFEMFFHSFSNKVFKHNGTNYVQIITLPPIKNDLQAIVTNQKRDNILMRYRDSNITFLLHYSLNQTTDTWNSRNTVISFTDRLIQKSYTRYSQNFETIILGYQYSGSSGIQLANLNAKTNSSKLYDIPQYLLQLQYVETPLFLLSNNYCYFMMKGMNHYYEYIYRLDKINTQLILIYKRLLRDQLLNDDYLQNLVLEEKDGKLFIISTYFHTLTNSMIVTKKQISNKQELTVKQMSKIQIKQTSVDYWNGWFYKCPLGCSHCNNPTVCQTCSPGWVLDQINYYCVKCPQNCQSCSLLSANCLLCLQGFYLSQSECLPCHSSCIKCRSSQRCSTCPLGLGLSDSSLTRKCTPLIQDCLATRHNYITANIDKCSICKLGYVYNQNISICVECPVGCTNCNYDKIYQCSSCAGGFEPVYLGSMLKGCTKCPLYCEKCLNGICNQCKLGYRLFNKDCVKLCKLPCKQCNKLNSTKCTSCIGGYDFNPSTSQCIPKLDCNKTNQCVSCPIGQALIFGGMCLACNAGRNCESCQAPNLEKCVVCKSGFYLSKDSFCTPCIQEGCLQCKSSFTCTQCADGYTLAIIRSGILIPYKCLKCEDSCKTCHGSPQKCETCATGYARKGWKCVSIVHISFNFTLNGDFNTLTTASINTIKSQICTALNKSKKDIFFDEIKSGSIVLSGIVMAVSESQATSIKGTLDSAGLSSLGGFPVLGYFSTKVTLTPTPQASIVDESETIFTMDGSLADPALVNLIFPVYTNNTQEPIVDEQYPIFDDESRINEKKARDRLAIILGVAIPAVVITAVIVIVILYKKRNRAVQTNVIFVDAPPNKQMDMIQIQETSGLNLVTPNKQNSDLIN